MAKTRNNTPPDLGTQLENLKEMGEALNLLRSTLQTQLQKKEIRGTVSVDRLGEVVTAARREQKVTMKVLAALAGVSLGTVQKVEKGSTAVSLQNLNKILGALGKKLWIQ